MPAMSAFPEEAVSFEIIDADTGNTVASFADAAAAEACLLGLLEAASPPTAPASRAAFLRASHQAEELVLVAFDKSGNAVGSEMAGHLLVR